MKKKLLVLGIIFAALVMLSSCSSFSGVVPVITIEGEEITIGTSSMSAIVKAHEEFQPKVGASLVNPSANLDGNCWLSDNINFGKDNKNCAIVKVYNPDSKTQSVLGCPIWEMTVKPDNTVSLLNGIDFTGMDSAKVKETMQSYKLALETDSGILRYEDGDYKYFFTFDEESGLLNEIRVQLVFKKSYDEKLW